MRTTIVKGGEIMIISIKIMTALTLIVLTASPIVAKTRAELSDIHIPTSRTEALRQCNAKATKFLHYLWGNYQDYQYRACMYQRSVTE
jgi:hypothetical protein